MSEAIPGLAKAKREGLARNIGVANFTTKLLDEAIQLCPEPLSPCRRSIILISTRPSCSPRRAGIT